MRRIQFLFPLLMVLAVLSSCTAETPTPEQAAASAVSSSTSPDGSVGVQPESLEEFVCPETSPHPVAADIAETFDVEYELVIGWFCDGHAFDEILLALQTQKIVEVEVDFLLKERDSGKSWDQIWRELEITSS